ncbi:MAG: hypothetical protein AVDCRST_MAG18-2933 [uncultured Thermomicrobiales bacterium]|uniref:Uncharacterized protein n=1 Tax=uncultured Thermomicrobiales bacterium TaxID=1645740 RepID=A0A6J4VIQ3_9BACT|nr:MAG: hypothetical protein AVDCRST_MAG18-2933 [uncultured Thermomicrobiales bacterium]
MSVPFALPLLLLALGWLLLFACARSLDRHYPRLARQQFPMTPDFGDRSTTSQR